MFKIGDFSRIAHVSVKTLRHYAQEGLLEPVWIDRFSGYRYYSLEQLHKLNRVLALKDLGFTLEQIKHLLDGDLSAAELRGMLRLKRVELKLRVQEEQSRLARVEKRLEQIETEGNTSGHDVILKPIQPMMIAWARSRAASEEQAEDAREGLRQMIHHWSVDKRLNVIGPWISVLENSHNHLNKVEIHLGVVVEGSFPSQKSLSASPVNLDRLEAIPLAACLLGANIGQVPHGELLNWIQVNSYQSCGETRLVYLGETPETPLAERVVEVQIPVKCDLEAGKVIETNQENTMEPVKYDTLPAFKVMGMKYRGKNENQEIAQMWGELNKRANEIPMQGECAYGVCLMVNDAPEGVFEYIAGFKVDAGAKVPEGMVVVDVPENRYAVFEHHGAIQLLGNTYNSIINEWFPRSGMKPTGGYDMEVYDERFKDFAPDSVFYIYEPVK